MKILFLPKYSRKGASSRLRTYQYLDFVKSQGDIIEVKPLFTEDYLRQLYNGNKMFFLPLWLYLKRFFLLFTVFKYDKIVIEKELFPYLPPLAERILHLFKISYIVDYDDAIFHNYDLHPNKFIRFVLKHKIDVVMACSQNVIAGNSYLATRASIAGAKSVHVIPTVVDLNRYEMSTKSDKDVFVIGWIGTPSTLKYLEFIVPVIAKLSSEFALELHIVGGNKSVGLPSVEKIITWSEDTEVSSICQFDLGVMPLFMTPWEMGKCSYKLIQYMACGIPIVASPVGMNTEVVSSEIDGFLASSLEEWEKAIRYFIENIEERRLKGLKGRKKVEASYSLNAWQRKYYDVITQKAN